jgi:hypothetical protein
MSDVGLPASEGASLQVAAKGQPLARPTPSVSLFIGHFHFIYIVPMPAAQPICSSPASPLTLSENQLRVSKTRRIRSSSGPTSSSIRHGKHLRINNFSELYELAARSARELHNAILMAHLMIDEHEDSSPVYREELESETPLDLSLVDLVLVASECTEDESELRDIVDDLMQSGRVQLRKLETDRVSAA